MTMTGYGCAGASDGATDCGGCEGPKLAEPPGPPGPPSTGPLAVVHAVVAHGDAAPGGDGIRGGGGQAILKPAKKTVVTMNRIPATITTHAANR